MYDVDDLLSVDPRRDFEQVLQSRCAARESFALMLVELDGFEEVSVEYGDQVSDLLLYEVASRLRRVLSEQAVLVRSGHTQFAVLLPAKRDLEEVEQKAHALIERVERPVTVSGTRFRLSASIGISLFPEHGGAWRTLLRNADAAAYDAKTRGRGRISISVPPS